MKSDLDGLTSAERWRYHAYDYAFLRFRNEPQDSGYALDPHGKWFNEGLVQAAERIYAPRRPLPKPPIPRVDVEPDPDLAVHFRRQDDERIPLKRQVQAHGERLSNMEPTPEMLAFMVCCVRQQKANEKIFKGQTRVPSRPEAIMPSKHLLDALGVTVMERGAYQHLTPQQIYAALGDEQKPNKPPKHEDPEELRKAAMELGILQTDD